MEECKDPIEAPVARQLVSAFYSREFLQWLSKICDVQHLLSDPVLSRCGLYEKLYR